MGSGRWCWWTSPRSAGLAGWCGTSGGGAAPGRAWRAQISNWHTARVSNAPTEAANNLIKRVKRSAFGFTNFDNYRIRALLYAGKPNWALLETLTPT